MGYLTVDNGGRLRPATTMGENFFNKILGITGDHIKRYEDQGHSLTKIYNDWREVLARYTKEASLVASGSGKVSLMGKADMLNATAQKLAPRFAPGAVQGAADRDTLNAWVAAIKDFGAAKSEVVRASGLNAPEVKQPAVQTQQVRQASMFGNIPIWGWGLALLALAKFSKR